MPATRRTHHWRSAARLRLGTLRWAIVDDEHRSHGLGSTRTTPGGVAEAWVPRRQQQRANGPATVQRDRSLGGA